MANNSPNNPILEPGLSVRIIDGSSSQTSDTLYFIGTENNYVKKSGKSETRNYSTFGNFWTKQISVENNFRYILDGGTSEPGTAQFYGPIIGGEFPTQTRLLNQL
jgi:hypothetical protein